MRNTSCYSCQDGQSTLQGKEYILVMSLSNRQKTKSQPKVDEHFTKAIVQTNGDLTILAISEDSALIELTFTSLHTMFILGDMAEHVMAD